MLGHSVSAETRKKLSNAHIGYRPTQETKTKISASTAGKKNGFYGKTHSDKFKKKLSELRKKEADERGRKQRIIKRTNSCGEKNPMFGKIGRITGSKNPKAKRIVVDGIEYETMKAASIATGLSMHVLRKWHLNNTEQNNEQT